MRETVKGPPMRVVSNGCSGVTLTHFPKKHLRGKIMFSTINRWTENCLRGFCDLAHIYCKVGPMDSEVTGKGGGGAERELSKEVRRRIAEC